MNKLIKRSVSALLSVIFIISVFNVQISADMTFVPINGQTVVDKVKVKGVTVKAYYTNYFSGYDSDMTSLGSNYGGYCCAGLVYQFYKRVYGIKVNNLFAQRNAYGKGEGSNYKLSSMDGLYYNTPCCSSGYFYRIATPQVGDVFAQNNHWGIVKKVSGTNVTLIEQNYWCYPYTQAQINRVVSTTDSNYWFFRYSGAGTIVAADTDTKKEKKSAMGSAELTGSYEVWTVCSSDGLNVRSGAGSKNSIVGTINDGSILHIYDKKINGGYLWGKCETGWCALDYCDYVTGTCGKDTFVVTFKPNGAKSGKMKKKLFSISDSVKLPKCSYTYNDHKFLGWSIYRKNDTKWLYTNGKVTEWFIEKKQPFGYKKYIVSDNASTANIAAFNNNSLNLCANWSGVKIKSRNLGYIINSYAVYKGGNQTKPSMKIFYGGYKLKNGTDYTLLYSGGKYYGSATVYIKFKGNYKGSYSSVYTVIPSATKGVKVSKTSVTAVKLKWKKNSSAKGYRIYRYNPSVKKYKKVITITKNKTTSFIEGYLKSNTLYYYAIRSYVKYGGKYYFSQPKYINAVTK